MVISQSFFEQPTTKLAKSLLGTFLCHRTKDGISVGRIVETEAYLSRGDPACHAARGKTSRNAAMFGPAGHAYIYFIYGMYYCCNVVSAREGRGEAILIRALEPVRGIHLMKMRRGLSDPRKLCNGPAKLVIALGISHEQNTLPLYRGNLTILKHESLGTRFVKPAARDIVITTRIGIRDGVNLPLRFYIRNNLYISKK